MNLGLKFYSIEFYIDEFDDSLLARENTHSQKGDLISSERLLILPLEEIRSREPAEVQRMIGRLVLTFLNSRSSKDLCFPRDLDDERRQDEAYFRQLNTAASSNEPEKTYDLAVSLIAKGMSSENWADIEQGESLLAQAVAAGLPEAIKYQSETWSLLRPRLEHKLKKL
ncbi:MAG: hypothetical protein OJI67_05160 [Prosthecobacter sp.]|nr:hypothetical protein [Prosthecobacter sp.]